MPLKPYPAYKPAAVPWLQQVPEHWEFKRAKSVFFGVDVKSKTGKEELLTVSSANGIVKRRESNVNMFKAKTYVGHKLCWPEDLVINSLWAWGRGLGFSREHGIISTAYGVYRLREQQKHLWQYLDYTLRSSTYQWELQVRSKGVWKSRLQLTDASFFDMPILMPPKEDAELIVRYLHALDAKVKRYIRTKRTLIARLQEQKQAIIQRAVTRGLDPNVKLKPSGVEWLGEVPEHWAVMRLRSAFLSVDSGVWGIDVEHEDDDDNVYCMRAADFDMQTYTLNPAKRILRKVNAFDRQRKSLIKGDLLLEKSGGGDAVPVGRVVYADGASTMVFSNFLTRLRPDQSRFDPKYLLYLLNTLHGSRVILADIKQTTGLQNLDERAYLSRTVLIPRLDEQLDIVVQLDQDFEKVNQTITTVQRDIQLMLEYHTRLIADVVTGAVDVTAAAKAMAVETGSTFAEATADEEEPLSMAAEGEDEYGAEDQ